jgi:hypothetical protein
MRLQDIARDVISGDPATKSLRCYQEYDDYFRRHGLAPKAILEVGVHRGESTRVFARAIPEAHIVAIDLVLDVASHVGAHSAATCLATYPFLRSGGVYIVEDWGTGYLEAWIDGSAMRDGLDLPSKHITQIRSLQFTEGICFARKL